MNAVAAQEAPAQPAASGTNETAGARRIAAAFEGARADGRVALVPYVVAGYPDAETSLRVAQAAIDAGADGIQTDRPGELVTYLRAKGYKQ